MRDAELSGDKFWSKVGNIQLISSESNIMRKLLLLITSIGFLLGADAEQNQQEHAKKLSRNANSIVIDRGGKVRMLGELMYSMGNQSGQFTGSVGKSSPAGPVIVYVFKSIPSEYGEAMAKNDIRPSENSAYLLNEYSAAALRKAVFIREIDPNLSDGDLARSFGVDTTVE